MILYVVEAPPEEHAGDGEDTREWFGTLAQARKRFRELVKQGEAYVKARKAREADPTNEELADAAEAINPEWKYLRIELSKYDIPLKKADLVHHLNHQLLGCGTVIEQWEK